MNNNNSSMVTYHPQEEILIYQTGIVQWRYSVFQIQGQKYVKIMNHFNPPPFNSEVYAINIPRMMDIVPIFKFFASCGKIYQIRLLMDFSGTNRGKCYVQYQTVEGSRAAICCLNGEIIGGNHKVTIQISLNNNQLVLNPIPDSITDQEIIKSLMEILGEGLMHITIRPMTIPNKNYCYCTYRNHQYAIMAYKKAWPTLSIFGIFLGVQWAVPKLLRYGSNLYFTNFPCDMTSQEFFHMLVTKIDLKTLTHLRIDKKIGCITFSHFRFQKQAAVYLQNATIRGINLKFSTTPFLMEDKYKIPTFPL